MKTMKTKVPKDFGESLHLSLFDESQHNICDFTVDFCNAHPKVREDLNMILGEVDEIQDEKLRSGVKWSMESLPDYYAKCHLMIGFALGQAYEVPNSEVEKDIDLFWKIAKEWGLFSIYPKRRKQ
jgi:hypothetical protein